MNRMFTTALLTAATLAMLAVASVSRAGDPRPTPAGARVLGHLELHARRITIKQGGRFTVRTKDGKVLADNVSMRELKAMDPLLQEKLERIMAGKTGVIWAGR